MKKIQIKLSMQKKFLFIPLLNFMIIYVFSLINLSYLKSKGIRFGFFNIKFVFGAFIYLIWGPLFFVLFMSIVIHFNVPTPLFLFLMIISMYFNSVLIGWGLIKYQKKLSVEE